MTSVNISQLIAKKEEVTIGGGQKRIDIHTL